MVEENKTEVVDFADEMGELFEEVGRYDIQIHALKGEIAKAEYFIEFGGEEDDDYESRLDHSLGIQTFKDELEKHKRERDEIMIKIEALQRSSLGEEIPRDEKGQYQVPWDTIKLANSQVEGVMGER